jgi:hypothetical protein
MKSLSLVWLTAIFALIALCPFFSLDNVSLLSLAPTSGASAANSSAAANATALALFSAGAAGAGYYFMKHRRSQSTIQFQDSSTIPDLWGRRRAAQNVIISLAKGDLRGALNAIWEQMKHEWDELWKPRDISNIPILSDALRWIGSNDIGNVVLKILTGIDVNKQSGSVTISIGDALLDLTFVTPLIGAISRGLGGIGRGFVYVGRTIGETRGMSFIRIGEFLKGMRAPYIKVTSNVAIDFGHKYPIVKDIINSVKKARWPMTFPHINTGTWIGEVGRRGKLIPLVLGNVKIPHVIPLAPIVWVGRAIHYSITTLIGENESGSKNNNIFVRNMNIKSVDIKTNMSFSNFVSDMFSHSNNINKNQVKLNVNLRGSCGYSMRTNKSKNISNSNIKYSRTSNYVNNSSRFALTAKKVTDNAIKATNSVGKACRRSLRLLLRR